MSQKNLEAVRAVYAAWRDGNFRTGVDLYDPFAVLVQGPDFPESGAWLGIQGIGEYMRAFLDAWTRVAIEADELLEAGDTVVAAVTQRGTGKDSGVTGEFRYFHVWSFRAGKVIRLEVLRDRAEALEAAGITG